MTWDGEGMAGSTCWNRAKKCVPERSSALAWPELSEVSHTARGVSDVKARDGREAAFPERSCGGLGGGRDRGDCR